MVSALSPHKKFQNLTTHTPQSLHTTIRTIGKSLTDAKAPFRSRALSSKCSSRGTTLDATRSSATHSSRSYRAWWRNQTCRFNSECRFNPIMTVCKKQRVPKHGLNLRECETPPGRSIRCTVQQALTAVRNPQQKASERTSSRLESQYFPQNKLMVATCLRVPC